jgi:hypothetical protein
VATFVANNVTAYAGPYDMTTDLNKLSLKGSADELDSTTFQPPGAASAGWRTRVGGLKDFDAALEGFWQSGTAQAIDPQAMTNLGVADTVLTWSPTGVAGDPCYILQGNEFGYSQGDQVGALWPFKLAMKGSNAQGMIRGQLAAASQSKAATGQLGSILTMTGPSASQYVYGSVHLMGTVATTITIKIQSSTVIGFGSPTDRITIGPLTTLGGTFATRLAGAITDGYWRMNISAITGTWTVAGAIGIQ